MDIPFASQILVPLLPTDTENTWRAIYFSSDVPYY